MFEFLKDWHQDENPWLECIRSGQFIFGKRFLIWSIIYVVIDYVGNWCKGSYYAAVKTDPNSPDADIRGLKGIIATRTTVIAATFHSISTSIIACGLLAAYYSNNASWDYEGFDLLKVWQRVGLPISLAYFVTDTYFYCLKRGDVIIFFHHFVMCFCHYPVVTDSGAFISGVGSREWISWLSIMGYTSEVSTALMNYRWYLIHTLEKNWIGFGLVNILVVIGWAGRVVMFTYLLVKEVLPRYSLYVAKNQMFTYSVIVFGHAGIGFLSLYWCMVMCKGGLRNLFVFKTRMKQPPQPLDSNKHFSFADEVGRCNMPASPPASSPVAKKIIAYVDGTVFDEKTQDNGDSRKKVQ